MQNKERQITIRRSVRPQLAEKIPSLIEEAINWLQPRYASVDFSKVEYIFSSNYCRSRYWRNDLEDAKYRAPNACISTRALLALYDKKTLNLKKTRLFVGSEVQMMCALIHELTHHAQHELDMPRGELETTRNEIEYLREFYPKYYSKMVKA